MLSSLTVHIKKDRIRGWSGSPPLHSVEQLADQYQGCSDYQVCQSTEQDGCDIRFRLWFFLWRFTSLLVFAHRLFHAEDHRRAFAIGLFISKEIDAVGILPFLTLV